MEITTIASRQVGDIVAEDYRRAAALKRFNIDFCCGGAISLTDACAKKGVAVDEVIAALAASDSHGTTTMPRVTAWEPGFLADYVVNEHHSYVRENVPVLRAFTQKVARVHGAERPELLKIADLFEALATELEDHMVTEESVVFPRIKAPSSDGAPLSGLIDELESEHDLAGNLMREIRELSADFNPPMGACNTYRATFAKLEEFEDDLHRHVHIENNVLFPKAIAVSEALAA